MDEYSNVLQRLGLNEEKEVEEILQLFARNYHCLFTATTPKLSIVDADPDDNKFFECAVALQAQALISGDRAVLQVEKYMDIEVLGSRQFLDSFSGRKQK